MDYIVILLLILVIIAIVLTIGDFTYHYVKARKPTLSINHLLGRVFPMPDDPLWCVSEYTHPSNVNHCYYPSIDLDKYQMTVTWNKYDGGHLGIKDYSYRLSSDNRKEQIRINNYCATIIENVRARQQQKLDQIYTDAINKWPQA